MNRIKAKGTGGIFEVTGEVRPPKMVSIMLKTLTV